MPSPHHTPDSEASRHDPDRHNPDRPVYEHAWEDALEPRHLINRSEVIARVGHDMLAAGTGARRVDETMRGVARSLDIDNIQTRIDFTSIVLSVQRRGIFRTLVKRVTSPGVDADKIAELQRFSRSLEPHMTVAEVERRLDAIAARPKRWPRWGATVGAGPDLVAFAVLNNAGWLETLGVFIAALAGQWLRRQLHRRHLNPLAMVFLAAAVAGIVFVLMSSLLEVVFHQSETRYAAGFVSSILFLIPGFPLITATLDLARVDLAAGISRLTYATLVTFTAGVATWLVASAAAVTPAAAPLLDLSPWALWGLRIVASFFGVFGFAVVFNSPPLVAVAAGVIALIVNPLRILLVEHGMTTQLAAALATFTIGLLAVTAGRLFKLPRIILSVPSVVIMIPGAMAFRSLVLLQAGDIAEALRLGVQAGLIIVGMAAGLVAARMLTDPEWAFTDGRRRQLIPTPSLPALPNASLPTPSLPLSLHLPKASHRILSKSREELNLRFRHRP